MEGDKITNSLLYVEILKIYDSTSGNFNDFFFFFLSTRAKFKTETNR